MRNKVMVYQYELVFELNAKNEVAVVDHDDYFGVRKGHKVRLTYRIGRRSGMIHVDRIEPVGS